MAAVCYCSSSAGLAGMLLCFTANAADLAGSGLAQLFTNTVRKDGNQVSDIVVSRPPACIYQESRRLSHLSVQQLHEGGRVAGSLSGFQENLLREYQEL